MTLLDGCHGVAVLQHFLTVVMSQGTVESAGDVGVTASDPVDHIDAVVRRFTVVAVFLRRVDDGGKVVLLRVMTVRSVEATTEIGYSSQKDF